MVRIAIAATALFLGTLSSALALHVIEQNEDAYELALGTVSLPANERGAVIFTACDTCRTQTLRVTEQTRYAVNGSEIPLTELREIAEDWRSTADGRENAAVIIFFDTASLRVNRLALSYRD